MTSLCATSSPRDDGRQARGRINLGRTSGTFVTVAEIRLNYPLLRQNCPAVRRQGTEAKEGNFLSEKDRVRSVPADARHQVHRGRPAGQLSHYEVDGSVADM